MKKCIFSAIAGALGMLLLLYGIAAVKVSQEEKEYEHIDFVSELPQEDCFFVEVAAILSYPPIGERTMLALSI